MQSQEEKWLLEEKYNGQKTEGFLADLEILKSGAPLAYLIGHTPFLGATITLDSHPLIPRPETELWTEKAIAHIQQTKAPTVLDLCAGSGAIGVAVLQHTDATVTFGEIDTNHLPTILENLATNNCDCSRYKVVQSDLFEATTGKFDFILTNPPYIDPAIDRTEPSVKLHEPHLALYGGEAGMEIIAKIITEAPQHLTPTGELWIEHEPEQSAVIAALATQHGFVSTTKKDQYDTERYSILTRTALE